MCGFYFLCGSEELAVRMHVRVYSPRRERKKRRRTKTRHARTHARTRHFRWKKRGFVRISSRSAQKCSWSWGTCVYNLRVLETRRTRYGLLRVLRGLSCVPSLQQFTAPPPTSFFVETQNPVEKKKGLDFSVENKKTHGMI